MYGNNVNSYLLAVLGKLNHAMHAKWFSYQIFNKYDFFSSEPILGKTLRYFTKMTAYPRDIFLWFLGKLVT